MVIRSKKSRESCSGFSIFGRYAVPTRTKAEHVYSTYIAYTATPQANFLSEQRKTAGSEETLLRRYAHPVRPEWVSPLEITYDGGNDVRNCMIVQMFLMVLSQTVSAA